MTTLFSRVLLVPEGRRHAWCANEHGHGLVRRVGFTCRQAHNERTAHDQRSLVVHVRNRYLKARSPSGRMLAGGRVPNTLMDLSRELAGVEREALASGEPVRAVMEATTNSRAIPPHWPRC